MAADRLRDAVLAGRPLGGSPIIDAHAHLGAWFNFPIPDRSLEAYVRLMDLTGIQISCVTGLPSIGPWMQRGNALVADAVARYPQRFVAYCTVNPHRPEESAAELEHWRMPLVKFHPSTHQYPMDGPGYEPALRFAAEHACPVLIHVWQGDAPCEPARLARIAARYPSVPFIAGHSGGTEQGFRECIAIATELPNVYLDPTGSRVYAGSVEALVAGPGPSRVLLGTDMGFFNPCPQIGRIVFAHSSEKERRLILGENMRQLLLKTTLLPATMRQHLDAAAEGESHP